MRRKTLEAILQTIVHPEPPEPIVVERVDDRVVRACQLYEQALRQAQVGHWSESHDARDEARKIMGDVT